MDLGTVALGELIKRVVTATADWLGSGKKRRAAFFREQVELIHAVFVRFKEEHRATFAEVRAGLRDKEVPQRRILDLVAEKIRAERESWMLFARFNEIARHSKADPSDLYFAYLAEIRRCLIFANKAYPDFIPPDDNSARPHQRYHGAYGWTIPQVGLGIAYYWPIWYDLRDSDREANVKNLDNLVIKFDAYVADVEIAYLKLRGESLVQATYLANGGTLEHAQQIAAHASPKTTKLYDRTRDTITLDEIERIVIRSREAIDWRPYRPTT